MFLDTPTKITLDVGRLLCLEQEDAPLQFDWTSMAMGYGMARKVLVKVWRHTFICVRWLRHQTFETQFGFDEIPPDDGFMLGLAWNWTARWKVGRKREEGEMERPEGNSLYPLHDRRPIALDFSSKDGLDEFSIFGHDPLIERIPR